MRVLGWGFVFLGGHYLSIPAIYMKRGAMLQLSSEMLCCPYLSMLGGHALANIPALEHRLIVIP